MQIHHQHFVLTGAASGIGLALLRLLVGFEGLSIVAADLHEADLTRALESLPKHKTTLYTFVADLAQEDATARLIDYATQTMGTIDVFVANAGFAYYEPAQAFTWQRAERLFAVNVLAPIDAWKRMKALNTGRPYYVLMTASSIGKLGIPGFALYGASKAALVRFADSVWHEPSTDQGTLGLVYPISTKSNFFARAVADERLLPPVPFPASSPERVARAMLWGIRHNKRRIYPSWLFQFFRLPQIIFEASMKPYQWFYGKLLRRYEQQQDALRR